MDEACQIFGDAFVSYCLNVEVDSLRSATLSSEQLEVLQALMLWAGQISTQQNSFARSHAIGQVLSFDAAAQTTLPNIWRQHCGGSLLAIESDDPLEEALLHLGRDFFAGCLLPRPTGNAAGGMSSILTMPTFKHPKIREFAQAVLRDSVMCRLFPGVANADTYNGDGADVHSHLLWSSGQGGTCQLILLPSSLLGVALRRLGAHPTPGGFFDVLRWALKLGRNLAAKRNVHVPVLVGLAHIELVNGEPIFFQGGQIRVPTDGDRENLWDADGITAVLEVEVPVRLLSVRYWAPGPQDDSGQVERRWETARPSIQKFQDEMRRRINLIRLAMLFASPSGEVIAPAEMVSTAINPLSLGQSASMSVYRYPMSAFASTQITAEVGTEIQRWVVQVAKHPTGLDMAMRRLLSAVSTRPDPMDGFVDAVICWENIFGTNEGEVTFRVCGAMAILLEPDDMVKRRALFKELKELYGVRSELVHGANEPSIADAYKHRERSVDVATQALKALYSRPDLLNAPGSNVRGRMLLLGV
ncbi:MULTISPECIES: HEPN domain-containing protein [Streptacidiphilus]|uniref:HEPN domain-containing protein n=1 Tax=Streptacidiphilus cavernicola TaxID=3342716 RepID=A0ABV6UXC1_9ACTN|nr:HEPN domain-containing protein [Streptacidiphilus jeojiense]